jgi:hypothetical protein
MIELPIKLGQDLKDYLLEVSRHVLKNKLHHYDEKGYSDLHVFSILESNLVDEMRLNRIMSSLDCKCKLYFLSYPSYGINPWHHDTESQRHRKSCVTWNLAKNIDTVAPTLFKIDNHVHYHTYNDNGFILDTRYEHSMKNGADDRHLFQMTFNMEPDEVSKHFLRSII